MTIRPAFPEPHIEALARRIGEAAALPLERSVTLPREAYTDEAFFRLETKTVFETDWLCIGHVSQVKEPGAFRALDLLGEPLLLIRDEADMVRVLSRVCAHRAMDIMPEGFCPREGKAALLSCPYHHWIYETDGALRGCAQMERAEGFRKADWRLKEFRSTVWHGFVFVNLDGRAEPLEEQYAAFSKLIAPWKPEEMEVVITLDWDCGFNWKVMIENWMESYHHLGAHHVTLNPMMPGETTWIEPEHPHFIRAHLPFNPRLAEEVRQGRPPPGFLPVPGLSHEQQSEWGLYLGHPCFMFLTMGDRVLWYLLFPESAGRCRLQTMTLVRPESKAAPDYETRLAAETKMLADFHGEDMLVNTGVQRGLSARAAVRGRLSHLEEPIWLIQRYLAARLSGAYPPQAERSPYFGPRGERTARGQLAGLEASRPAVS